MDRFREAESWLHQELDGVLSPSDGVRLRDHLDSCAECHALAEDLRRLREETEALPLTMEPPRDLWMDIAAQLDQRGTEASFSPWWESRAFQAIAALLLLTIGFGFGRWSGSPEGALSPSLGEPSPVVQAASLQQVEADYLRAREGLWLELLARHREVDPETLELVAKNLQIINQATEDVRRALELQPGEPQLEALLYAQYEREVELLRRFVRLTA